jgi:uncharacterized protein (DUF1697 family)
MPIVYVALLRGVNVGGKNIVSMNALKESFERLGFQGVTTYINSGNVVFRSTEADRRKLEDRIDRVLLRQHGINGKTVVRSLPEIARLVKTISKTWNGDPRWRYNVIFLRHSIDSARVLEGITLKPDLERVVYCRGTLLWSARLSGLTRTAMLKLVRQPIYKEVTVRNVNTTKAIFRLMQGLQKQVIG